MIDLLAQELGCKLAKRKFDLPNGRRLEIDAGSRKPPVVCEAWAHQGPPKSAQKNKVMADALKLVYVASILDSRTRKILLFADQEAARPFRGGTWMAEALAALKVEVRVVPLPEEIRTRIRKAQERQYR